MIDIPMDDVIQVSLASIAVAITAVMLGRGLEKLFFPMGKLGALLQVAATALSFVLLRQVLSQFLGTTDVNLNIALGTCFAGFAFGSQGSLAGRLGSLFDGINLGGGNRGFY